MDSVRLQVKGVAGSEPAFSALRPSCESLFLHCMCFSCGIPKGPIQSICECCSACPRCLAAKNDSEVWVVNIAAKLFPPPRKFGAIHLICFVGFHSPPRWSHASVKGCSTLLRTVTAQQWTRCPRSVLRTWEQGMPCLGNEP